MQTYKKIIAIVCTVAAVWLSMPIPVGAGGSSLAQKSDRKRTWDFYLPLIYTEAATIDGQQGAEVDIDDGFGVGFGVGYNFNDHLQLGGLFNWSSRSYDATAVGEDGSTRRYSNYLETSSILINGTYYILDSNLTPFVSGMIGYTFADTNIQNAPASDYCWYDPWWGYVCSEYVPTKTEDGMSYGAGLGIRFDISRKFGMQGSYNKIWIDFDNAAGTSDFETWHLDFIFRIF
jgi:opacity protein-like surface antigen